MNVTNHDGVAGFNRLSAWISYYSSSNSRPSSKEVVIDEDPPLIVLCTWVAANPKHIAKYTASYQRLFPNSSILVVQTWTYDVVVLPTDGFHSTRLQPAHDIILSFLDARPESDNTGIVFHAFSNGGALTTGLLSEMLRSSRPRRRDWMHALLLDSCPGQGGYLASVHAIIVSGRLHTYPYVIYAIASLLVHIAALYIVACGALRIENMIDRVRRRLNDETLISSTVPRLYLYSKVDELVHWTDVVSHAGEARHKGYEVDEVVFQNSEHCAHLQESAARYWDAVIEFLRKADSAGAKIETN
ncbi:hypothetical protein AK830_g9992 [Neonectria ditissima]|uniref:Transmembrane protein 53 n=1 Tax=Neonectria ditissima TaxID=78410 RepID=A0A0P7AR04_9HYPO|nr:hypothetical protein AK830_g9992 [Neonectria ditissima]